jgi:hypothetical protein
MALSLLALIAGYATAAFGLFEAVMGAWLWHLAATRHLLTPLSAALLGLTLTSLSLGLAVLGAWAARRGSRARRWWLWFGGLRPWGTAAEGQPAEARALTEQAVAQAFAGGDLPKARRLLDRWLEEHPTDPAARRDLVAVLAASGEGEALVERLRAEEAGSWRLGMLEAVLADGSLHALPQRGYCARPLVVLLLLALPLAGLQALALGGPLKQALVVRWRQPFTFFSESDFETGQTAHFTVYHHDPSVFAEVSAMAEEALAWNARIYGMGLEGFGGGRLKLYVCATQSEYLKRSPYTLPWQAAVTVPQLGAIYLYLPRSDGQAAQRYMLRDTLAHETGHLFFDRAFPRLHGESWLEEGWCTWLGTRFAYESGLVSESYLSFVGRHYLAGLKDRRLPFTAFLEGRPQGLQGRDIHTFYMQGFSIVALLIEYQGLGGAARFMDFLRAYALKGQVESALSETYGPKINGMDDLQGMWLLFMT